MRSTKISTMSGSGNRSQYKPSADVRPGNNRQKAGRTPEVPPRPLPNSTSAKGLSFDESPHVKRNSTASNQATSTDNEKRDSNRSISPFTTEYQASFRDNARSDEIPDDAQSGQGSSSVTGTSDEGNEDVSELVQDTASNQEMGEGELDEKQPDQPSSGAKETAQDNQVGGEQTKELPMEIEEVQPKRAEKSDMSHPYEERQRYGNHRDYSGVHDPEVQPKRAEKPDMSHPYEERQRYGNHRDYSGVHDPEPQWKPVGLQNIGNTCFFNSALQILYRSMPFRKKLAETRDTHYGSESIAQELLYLFQQMDSRGAEWYSTSISPAKLFRYFSSRVPEFRLGEQEDSLSLLTQMLNVLDEQQGGKKATSAFVGHVCRSMECNKCKVSRDLGTLKSTSMLSLFLPQSTDGFWYEKKAVRIESLLETYSSGEDIEGFICPHCKKGTTAKRSVKYGIPPDCLIIHLKRFKLVAESNNAKTRYDTTEKYNKAASRKQLDSTSSGRQYGVADKPKSYHSSADRTPVEDKYGHAGGYGRDGQFTFGAGRPTMDYAYDEKPRSEVERHYDEGNDRVRGRFVKDDLHVTLGAELNMAPYCNIKCDTEIRYRLYGAIVHHGSSFSSGHYTALVRSTESAQWYSMNDGTFTQCRSGLHDAGSATVLFYERLL